MGTNAVSNSEYSVAEFQGVLFYVGYQPNVLKSVNADLAVCTHKTRTGKVLSRPPILEEDNALMRCQSKT